MEQNKNETAFEEEYLSATISQIETTLTKELSHNEDNRKNIVSAKKEMWDDAELYSRKIFERMITIGQYFDQIGTQISSHNSAAEKISILKKMLNTPYFARIDFTEEGMETEKIYIGRSNIMDESNYNIYVYDWRAPVSSVFYRFEQGEAYYDAPMERINGIVSLKRQYGIKNGKLNYFFDADINITDEILQKLLSENASSKMKAIVETIQRNQDMIIRDNDNDLLIVQGVAGSGKTSVALHRVAYLMYQGLVSKLRASDIVIISPNHLFSNYISGVLPELGESNIDTLIFEDLCKMLLAPYNPKIQSRNQFFEKLILCSDPNSKAIIKNSIEFKTSSAFITILERFTEIIESRLIKFEDIYYDDICLFSEKAMREFISKKGVKTPLATKLKNLENVILEKLREQRGNRIKKLEDEVREQGEHVFEVAEYARMLSIKESGELLEKIREFTEIDYFEIYKNLIQDNALFSQLTNDITLPENIGDILQYTLDNLQSDMLPYEDALVISYIKIKLTGSRDFYHFRQVVIDEAQDYYLIHYEILKLLFVNAKYTILGDINQTIEKHTDLSLYNEITKIFNKKKSIIVSMLKSFRSTEEILNFSEKYIDYETKPESISRHGEMPKIIDFTDISKCADILVSEIIKSREQGFESVGIICKSINESQRIYNLLKDKIEISLVNEDIINIITGVFVIPIYMVKGLEFDTILVYGMNPNTTDIDEQKLLYIACTRALHRLVVFNYISTDKED